MENSEVLNRIARDLGLDEAALGLIGKLYDLENEGVEVKLSSFGSKLSFDLGREDWRFESSAEVEDYLSRRKIPHETIGRQRNGTYYFEKSGIVGIFTFNGVPF